MTSNSDAYITDDTSSDDECLSAVKRKLDKSKNAEVISNYDDSGDERLLPEVLVRVEVEEIEESEDIFGKNRDSDDSVPKKKKKRNRPKPPKKIRYYNCPRCDAKFEKGADLKKHALTHQVATRHYCEECGRYFKKAFSLRLHSRIHVTQEFKCSLCELTFTVKKNLGRHLMTHERTEKCNKCPAKFHTEEQLKDHLQIHERVIIPSGPQHNNGAKISSENGDDNHSGNNMDLSNSTKNIKSEVDSDYVEDLANGEQIISNFLMLNHFTGSLKREDLSHPTQIAIVSKMHKGRPISDICRLYNITPEVLNEIWEDRDQYALPKKAGKRTTKYMNSILDKRIVDWFNDQRANDVQVSGKMLQDVAEAFAKEFGFVAFNGSKKWLDRFKKRYNILLRPTLSRRDYHNVTLESKWKKQFFKEQWCDARLGFDNKDIFTADEVGLYYNPSKGRVRKLAGKKYVHGLIQDRLSIFMCTNLIGTIKKKLLVCGSEDPLLHSHRNPDTLPVTYIRHTKAHFTTQMFEEYVKYWNRELQSKNKKAILILDRATIHSKLQLSNLKLVFVPWKASSGLMPIRNGIFKRFREEYRRLILEEKAMNVINGTDRNLTCLEALHMIDKAWGRLPPEVVVKGFEITGYEVEGIVPEKSCGRPQVYDNDEEVLCNMLKDFDVEPYYMDLNNLDMYLTVDEELVTGQGTNCSVFGGNHRVTEPAPYDNKDGEEVLPICTEKPESGEKEKLIKKIRALEDLEIVRKFLESKNTNYKSYCAFMDIEKFLMEAPLKLDS